MKGALILSKSPDFFKEFLRSIDEAGIDYLAADNSIKIFPDINPYLIIYDQIGKSGTSDDDELPDEALSEGYKYSFLVECRSEELFTEIFRSSSLSLDILIHDSDGNLFKPSELSADRIVL